VLTNRYGIVNESIKFIRSRVNVSEALSELEWLQARALTPPAYTAAAAAAKRTTTAKPEDLEKVFSEYEKTQAKRGVVDLGDLLSRTTHDIANDFDYAEATRWRYRHLLVDEAQDMNPQQFAFFSALRGKNRDVFVVGDPLQSIYGWNGAEPSLFDTLPEKLGGAHIVHLVNNYRCSPVIVAAGLHVLTNNGIPATARSTKLDGDARGGDRAPAERTRRRRRGARRPWPSSPSTTSPPDTPHGTRTRLPDNWCTQSRARRSQRAQRCVRPPDGTVGWRALRSSSTRRTAAQ
jgi:superfamily I DNA/RNA helicase